jgi:hypothetical protein
MRVPDYEQQVQPAAVTVSPPTAPTAVAGAFGADVARANAQTADVMGDISAHLFKMAQDASEKQILDRETEYRKEMQSVLFDPTPQTVTVGDTEFQRPTGVLNRQLEQSTGAIQDYDQTYYTQVREKYMKGLSPYQQGKLGTAMDNYYVGYRDNVIQHEASQGRLSYSNSWEKNINIKAADAFKTADPLALRVKVDGINAEIDNAFALGVIKYDASEKIKKELDTQLFYSRVGIDPQGTINDLTQGKDAEGSLYKNLDPQERSKFTNEANQIITKQKAEAVILRNMAVNKNEVDMVDLKIKGQLTPLMVTQGREKGNIGAKFADSMLTTLYSTKRLKAVTQDKDFTAMAQQIVMGVTSKNYIASQADTRETLNVLNATGQLSDEDYNILTTFNNLITNKNVDKAMPAKNFYQTITVFSDDYAPMRPAVRTAVLKSYMRKIAAQIPYEQAANEAMAEQILEMHPAAKTYPKGGKETIDQNGVYKNITPDLQITDITKPASPERQYMESTEENE